MKIIKPKRFISEKHKIGIVNTSSTPCTFPNRLKRSLDSLERNGFLVKLPLHFRNSDGYLPGEPTSRASDLMELVTNQEVGLILSSTGGLSTIEVLGLIDYNKIKTERKIFCGFSDFTILLLAIHFKTGLVTFYGPSLLPNFGEFGGINQKTFFSFKKTISANNGFEYEIPDLFSREEQYWDKEDFKELKYEQFPKMSVLVPGKAQGKIIAGNLESLVVLIGTEYISNSQDNPFILFIENTVSDTALLKRDLLHLELSGFFENVKGVVYGLPTKKVNRGTETVEKVLFNFFSKYSIPVAFGFPFGHINPNLTIPIGCDCKMDTTDINVTISIIESTVE